MLVGYARQILLGHAAFLGNGAYVQEYLTATYLVSPWIATAIGMVATFGKTVEI